MFEVGFSELLLISVIALVVLGPERLPKLVGQVGRWVGKARAMARQFREQLESEVNLDELSRTPPRSTSAPSYPPPGEAPPNEPAPAAATAAESPAPAASSSAPVDQSHADALSTAHLTPEQQHAIDTQHHDTVDYPYSASYHPEGDVYGGSPAPEPERILSEEPAAPASDATPAAAPAKHDERV